ncbi:molecular chaperone HscC [Stenotrophomonas sp. PS02289]|uniref:molecular chaperone HscC n=1 Tax=Stenotrophomonas sp. PS02289 TaxID=2991422 RepID=UPI00249B6781|nr:molecular chaperone HscC [Stenotrophomonas sp. PS02289]
MIVGIDLGTTHSLIGVHRAQGGELFPNAHGDLLTPSVVSLDGDTVLVGKPAQDRLVTHPHLSVAAFKRLMGTSHETKLGDRRFRPEELSALVLRSLLADAEAALGERVTEAVISVPAYFTDAQRKATRAAGELAGIKVERLINEPTAAALAYGLRDRAGEGRVLVLDLGGGTFDVSILELFDGVVEVNATAGDNYLGGEDFLELLIKTFCQRNRIELSRLKPVDLAVLRQRMEQFKRALTDERSIDLELKLEGNAFTWSLDEAGFAQLAEPLLQRMRAPIERAMRDAKLKPSDLDDIVLVGGAVRMPMVARLVTRMFGRLPLRHIHPDQAIALGATVAAGLKSRDESLEEVVLTDVCPYTLGTQVAHRVGNQIQAGYFHPIIPRNSVVPVSREDSFYPMHDGQKQVRIDVFQGESPMVEKNIKLGEINVPLTAGQGESGVLVRFTYDINGLLQVEVTETGSGKRHELLIEQNPGLMDDAEIRERLERLQSLKIHPREQQQNLALITRAERVYEEHVAMRSSVQEWIAHFRNTLESQDLARIEQDRKRFATALDELETL